MQIAYLVNQYPKVSHSFIRREILAIERANVHVERFALRGWDAYMVDKSDLSEQSKTKYILQEGVSGLIRALLKVMVRSPLSFFSTLVFALKLGWRSDKGYPYHFVYFSEACKLFLLLLDHDISHVHAHFGTNSAEIALLAYRLGGPPFSFTVHGPEEFDRPFSLKLAEKIKYASFVVAVSSYGRSQLYRLVSKKYWSKIKVVHCGIDAEFHQGIDQPVPENFQVVCVGRLSEQKGQMLLLDSVKKLVEQGISINLVLVGDGELKNEIQNLIVEYDLKHHVKLTGALSSEQVRLELLRSRALVLPSFAEGLPVVIMEAMILKRPVISTYVAGIPELVIHGETGWLIPAGSIDDLSNALIELLNTQSERLQEMGEQGYQRVVKRHDIATEAAKLISAIKGSNLSGYE